MNLLLLFDWIWRKVWPFWCDIFTNCSKFWKHFFIFIIFLKKPLSHQLILNLILLFFIDHGIRCFWVCRLQFGNRRKKRCNGLSFWFYSFPRLVDRFLFSHLINIVTASQNDNRIHFLGFFWQYRCMNRYLSWKTNLFILK